MKIKIFALFVFLFATPLSIVAAEKENQLVEKVIAAYGGDRLLNLSGYSIRDDFLSPTVGQSHHPDLLEVGQTKQILRVDLKTKKSSFDSWSQGRTGGFQGATISDGEKAYNVNYPARTYGEADNADVYAFAGGTMRTSDAILAYELSKVTDKVELLEDQNYLNRPHHVLKMPFPLSSDLRLFIDTETSLITRMVRTNPALGNLDYVYSGHKIKDGLTTASQTSFFIAGELSLVSTKHEVSFNPDFTAETFALPNGFKVEGERVDGSKMVINTLSKNVHHLGQNGGYTLFVDTPMGIIAAGGYAGLADRFKRYQGESNNFKPLAYQVVTHHHSDHIGGLGEAHSLGAKLVTVDANIETIKDSIAQAKPNFVKVENRMTLGEGRKRVEIYDVATGHSASFLLTYVPADKVIFMADHFGSQFVSGTPTANQGSVDILAAINALAIDVDKIATAHSARIFSINDLRKSVAEFKPVACSGERPVCT